MSAAVIHRNGSYLLCRRRNDGEQPGKWEFPGGKIEQGESPEACLVREIREELELDVTLGARIGVFAHSDKGRHLELVVFHAEAGSGTPALNNHDEVSWVSPHALLAYDLAPADIAVARSLAEAEEQRRKNASGGRQLM